MAFFFTLRPKKTPRKEKSKKLEWEKDPDIQRQIGDIVSRLQMNHINPNRVFCFRTTGSKAPANARIWSFPKVFQIALEIAPAYAIEIISEKYDRLSADEKTKVIIHELLHIPKNFSGSLLPHKYGNTRIDKEVESLYKKYKEI